MSTALEHVELKGGPRRIREVEVLKIASDLLGEGNPHPRGSTR